MMHPIVNAEENIAKTLLEKANKVRENSYSPFSNFRVGAAILLKSGEIVVGTNIENASFSVTLCAERAAFGQVISLGNAYKIAAIAVITSCSPPGTPCGVCRQFMAEFIDDSVPIYYGNDQGEYQTTTISKLLPSAFAKSDLA